MAWEGRAASYLVSACLCSAEVTVTDGLLSALPIRQHIYQLTDTSWLVYGDPFFRRIDGSPYPFLYNILPQDFMIICCPQDPEVYSRLQASPEVPTVQLPQDSPGPRSNTGSTKLCETSFPNPAREAERDSPRRPPGHQTRSLPASESGHFDFAWAARHHSAACNRGGSPAAPRIPCKQNEVSEEPPVAALACSLPLRIACSTVTIFI